jgi:hypothetical protein
MEYLKIIYWLLFLFGCCVNFYNIDKSKKPMTLWDAITNFIILLPLLYILFYNK